MQSTEFSIPAFPAFPSTTRYVPLGSLKEAVDRVCCSIDAREGTALVIGPPGTGKSLLCRLIVQQYQSTHDVVLIGDAPIADGDAFLRHLLHELNAQVDGSFAGDLHLALKDHVCNSDRDGLLLIIDEAQKLSPEVIEAVRMVTNIMRDGEPRTFVVLSGGVKLDEILIDSTLEAFTQRVATRCYLHPMNSEETRQYIRDTIIACGGDADETITAAAMTVIHQVCSGVPRLVNQMMTQAIDCADEMNRTLITEEVVNRAWADLQQLPSPMIEQPKLAGSESRIEFGELSELDEFSSWSPDDSTSNVSAAEESNINGSIEIGREESEHSDIEIGSPTANLLNDGETDQDCEQASQTGHGLFGEFDQEEEIAVGSGYAIASSNLQTEPSLQLEQMLQQEIVTAATNRGVSDHESEFLSESQAEDESASNLDVDEPQAIYKADEHRRLAAETCGVIPMPGVDDESMPTDDRDILVIEDELDLRSHQAGTRVDGRQKTISVDFQAMLSQMRCNS